MLIHSKFIKNLETSGHGTKTSDVSASHTVNDHQILTKQFRYCMKVNLASTVTAGFHLPLPELICMKDYVMGRSPDIRRSRVFPLDWTVVFRL